MTPSELKTLIDSDPTAKALFAAGNDSACALRIDSKCRDIVATGIAGKLVVEPGTPKSVRTDGIVIQTK